ncbi:uncharacterized protein LOC134338844 isoform X2 [Mobula hypostoma]|uniref:uncharacterized protein LOC134338844 isoform X2 n=1 Tax=Mobula hypostoma TaxID=723540 RepID=UPI002FC386D2
MGTGTCWWSWRLILITWLHSSMALFTEDTTIKVINISYVSQHMQDCWFDFKYYNITCNYIHLSIHNRTILDAEEHHPPVKKFMKSKGFEVEGCRTVFMRCYMDDMETHYIVQGTKDAKSNNGTKDAKSNNGTKDTKSNNGTEDAESNNGYWIAGVVVSVLVCLLALAVYYSKVRGRDQHILPFCCESQRKVPTEDPAVNESLRESQETLQSEQLLDRPDPSLCRQSICLSNFC